MFDVGNKIKVTGPGDETFLPEYIGKIGVIAAVDTTGGQCPVGQSEQDPFYRVEFPDAAAENFWGEEIAAVE